MKKTILTLTATLSFTAAETDYRCIATEAYMLGAPLVTADYDGISITVSPKKSITSSDLGTSIFSKSTDSFDGTVIHWYIKSDKDVYMTWYPEKKLLFADYMPHFNVVYKCKVRKK